MHTVITASTASAAIQQSIEHMTMRNTRDQMSVSNTTNPGSLLLHIENGWRFTPITSLPGRCAQMQSIQA